MTTLSPSNAPGLTSLSLPPPPPALRDRIHALWDRLATYPATRMDAALTDLLATLAELVDAQNACWTGMIRLADNPADPLGGWRPMARHVLRPLPHCLCVAKLHLCAIQPSPDDEFIAAQTRLSGAFRAYRLRDLVSPAWFNSAPGQRYRADGIHDLLTVGLCINPMTEACYRFLRLRPGSRFTVTQRRTAAYALRGMPMFHRQVLLAHGVGLADKPLGAVERKVIALLLTDQTGKEIAAALGVTSATAHTYVRDVLAKLGVRTRAGLAACFLGHIRPPPNS